MFFSIIKHGLAILLCLCCIGVNAQGLFGVITDKKGEPLPFASIFIEGTTIGTTANHEGAYNFKLKPGSYNISFQYVGYQKATGQFKIESESQEVNIALAEQAVELGTIEFTASKEDPAYPIIRAAIKKRSYYKNIVDAFSSRVYMKGIQEVKEAPDKFMGEEINSFGILDTNNQGIVYLSESISDLFYTKPEIYREVMLSSKVSGDNNGFSFNSARSMNFNLYEPFMDFNRQIISPIAPTAMIYYKYRLIGVFNDDQGRTINKIQVIPKSKDNPAYHGYIYIVDDLWNIHTADLYLTGRSIKMEILDTLRINQVFMEVKKPDVWMITNQNIFFDLKILVFKIGGHYTTHFSDYKVDEQVSYPEFKKGEVFQVEEKSNKKSLVYWDSIRPVPLTQRERLDYVRKDSLEKLWESKDFLDSMDRKENKFSVLKILTDYNWSNSYKRKYYTIHSPLNSLAFNNVQGLNLGFSGSYRHYPDKERNRRVQIKATTNYGFAEKKFRLSGSYDLRLNRTNRAQISISGGSLLRQFNKSNPISNTLNELYAVYRKENFAKFYEHLFGKVSGRMELLNGIIGYASIEYGQRNPLYNTSDYSFRKNLSRELQTNNPLDPISENAPFESHYGLVLGLDLRIRIKNKFASYPNRKFNYGSKFPVPIISYRKGINAFNSTLNYDYLSATVADKFSFGLLGKSDFYLQGGTFVNRTNIPFTDYKHFFGNQTLFASDKYNRTFNLMPYYSNSTASSFTQVHVDHHFNGFILNKIPLIKRLNFETTVGFHSLFLENKTPYTEFSVGIENIGWNLFRFMRVDYYLAFKNGENIDKGFKIGINLPFN